MTKHPYTDVVCWVLVALTLLAAVVFVNADQLGITISRTEMPYVEKLFDTNMVHSIDIVVDEDDWQNLLDNAQEKEYITCSIVIDGTALNNVGFAPREIPLSARSLRTGIALRSNLTTTTPKTTMAWTNSA